MSRFVHAIDGDTISAAGDEFPRAEDNGLGIAADEDQTIFHVIASPIL